MNKYSIDWTDSEALWKFTLESIQVAEMYKESRAKYAHALKYLKVRLAREYGAGNIEHKISEDKAYLVLADKDPASRDALVEIIERENEYKGLEKVMEARAAAVSFNQSLIKNQQRNT